MGVQSLNLPTAWASTMDLLRWSFLCSKTARGVMSLANMLKGQPVAELMQQQVKAAVAAWKYRGQVPKIVTLLVEGDAASAYYAQAKKRMATRLGIEYELVTFPHSVSERTILETITSLNNDSRVHGIMVELPLPSHISLGETIEAISPLKDVDGLTRFNQHANISGTPGIYPATPLACVRLLKHYGYTLSGKHVALVGCGKTVGMPLFHLLLRENATVTACHAGTLNLSTHLASAEVAFVAVGSAGLIQPGMVHPQLILIDAGINETANDKIVGDVAPEVAIAARALSPTPGGVGTVTTVQLFVNLMHAMQLQSESNPHQAVALSASR